MTTKDEQRRPRGRPLYREGKAMGLQVVEERNGFELTWEAISIGGRLGFEVTVRDAIGGTAPRASARFDVGNVAETQEAHAMIRAAFDRLAGAA